MFFFNHDSEQETVAVDNGKPASAENGNKVRALLRVFLATMFEMSTVVWLYRTVISPPPYPTPGFSASYSRGAVEKQQPHNKVLEMYKVALFVSSLLWAIPVSYDFYTTGSSGVGAPRVYALLPLASLAMAPGVAFAIGWYRRGRILFVE